MPILFLILTKSTEELVYSDHMLCSHIYAVYTFTIHLACATILISFSWRRQFIHLFIVFFVFSHIL